MLDKTKSGCITQPQLFFHVTVIDLESETPSPPLPPLAMCGGVLPILAKDPHCRCAGNLKAGGLKSGDTKRQPWVRLPNCGVPQRQAKTAVPWRLGRALGLGREGPYAHTASPSSQKAKEWG